MRLCAHGAVSFHPPPNPSCSPRSAAVMAMVSTPARPAGRDRRDVRSARSRQQGRHLAQEKALRLSLPKHHAGTVGDDGRDLTSGLLENALCSQLHGRYRPPWSWGYMTEVLLGDGDPPGHTESRPGSGGPRTWVFLQPVPRWGQLAGGRYPG